jgi:hypothetical protein
MSLFSVIVLWYGIRNVKNTYDEYIDLTAKEKDQLKNYRMKKDIDVSIGRISNMFSTSFSGKFWLLPIDLFRLLIGSAKIWRAKRKGFRFNE